jgi:lipoprotein Spr/probable lipoprotein NlpC
MARNLKKSLVIIGILALACGGPAMHQPLIPEPMPKDSAKRLLAEARSHLGEPYKYGGASGQGWDCSGFVRTMYSRSLGIELPRKARDMFARSAPVPPAKRRAGDLIFFQIDSQKPSHVGIYMWGDKFIHVSISDGVVISSLGDPYYSQNFVGVHRLTPETVAISR